MVVATVSGQQIAISTEPLTIVNEGASSGPRVVTATYRVGRWHRSSAQVSIDLDGSRFQDAALVWRMAARASVPVCRQLARRIRSGEAAPTVARSYSAEWITVQVIETVSVEGRERRLRSQQDFKWPGVPASFDVDANTVKRLADEMQLLADGLHVAIEDPANKVFFFGSKQIG